MTTPAPINPTAAADAAAKAARRAAPMFANQPTLDRYLACLFDTDRAHAPVEVRCVATGDVPLLMRPGTTDARVLDDTFIGLYHLPPAPLPDDAIILDLGANVGYTAVHFATLYPRARIVSVELDEGSADLARRNTAPFADRITVLHAAAWFEDSTVTYTTGDEWGLQVREQWAGTPEHARPAHATGARVISVPALSVDTIMLRERLPHIDFAKVDIEGAEHAVIRADAPWLAHTRSIQVEVHHPATVDGILAQLAAAGMRVRKDTRHWSCAVGVRA
ncbi:MAG: FkbM family methyltransferase [Phycisphaerales bacterium]|jgi:FkbM family methyltransferase|nr:FkbM family methyltransferase [Phycisphaeraceae bacterium]